jgi:molecular chaperone Hsp33
MSTDFILPFQLENATVRGRILRLDTVVREIIKRHQYPPVVNRILAEAIALSGVVFNCFKFDGTFTLQIKGEGLLSMLVVDITSEGHVRACVRMDTHQKEKLEKLSDATLPSVQALFGTGYLAFTIDPSDSREMYQGVVELSGSTLAECMHHFFRQSEQVETGIVVISNPTNVESMPIVGALLIQRLPVDKPSEQEEADDFWVKCLSVVGTVHAPELLSFELSLEDLLHRLFWEDGVRLHAKKPLVSQCRCSREKIESMLQTFDKEAMADMVVDEKISVKCEFCSENYDFLPENFDL